ncbi:[Acyl-carrier-protein] S-malonyltransferase [Saliniradius amylolyticus]|uniref:Malonyl CoA-acyl carrier protein transacylase n=1 Tax=Saliniradius amylolyticus TaxID=2183582 RepID=A0A2S2E301_9ALTE|nr:ACP S-malonyltransferase [Saliniradius amylolyticus]AWL12025.1 [Acyl-carrier-protein] S-malonyltransferase [Saliniradius amylolyticus]
MSELALVFPGQGSQTVGMLTELAERYSQVQETFEQASEALGYDLWALVQNGPESQLNETHRTQPALLTASVAIWRIWQAEGGAKPAMMAGHSLGEYSALVCAGVLDFTDAVKLVEKRGQLMQQAVPAGVGAMAAIIGLDDDKVKAACQQAAEGQVVSAVNFNSPGQVVIAGNKEAVDRAVVLCKDTGAKRALPLPVSVPSHCALMEPAAQELADALKQVTFNSPDIPVVNNVDVAVESDGDRIRDALVRQLYSPVRWTESVQFMAGQGISTLAETGPGKVLTGLARRIDKSLAATAINTPDSLKSLLEKGE